jgi:uncharacterized protein (DUF488 family)
MWLPIPHYVLRGNHISRLMKINTRKHIKPFLSIPAINGEAFSCKKFPWFSINELPERLMKENINYVWLGEGLGGYRKEGYENYIKSEKFKEGINKIEELSKSKILAIMCSEKLWFKCHRRFIANILVEKGYEVIHIFDEKKKQKHKL